MGLLVFLIGGAIAIAVVYYACLVTAVVVGTILQALFPDWFK